MTILQLFTPTRRRLVRKDVQQTLSAIQFAGIWFRLPKNNNKTSNNNTKCICKKWADQLIHHAACRQCCFLCLCGLAVQVTWLPATSLTSDELTTPAQVRCLSLTMETSCLIPTASALCWQTVWPAPLRLCFLQHKTHRFDAHLRCVAGLSEWMPRRTPSKTAGAVFSWPTATKHWWNGDNIDDQFEQNVYKLCQI